MSSVFVEPFVKEMSKYTDADPIFHRACALTIFGALLTRQSHRCVLAMGVPRRWTNLWTVLVAPSGIGRKSTAIGMAVKIVHRIDPAILGPDEMSPEGLLEHLAERGEDPSTLLVQSEYSSLLLQLRRQYAHTLRGVLLQFYDVPDVYNRRIKAKRIELASPRAALLGGIATELLADYGKSEDWLGGLFNRSLFIAPSDGKRDTFKEEPEVPDALYDKLATKLGWALDKWRIKNEVREAAPFELSKGAKKIRDSLVPTTHEPHLYNTLSRTSTHFAKVAAIEQIDEDPEAPEIGKVAAERALILVGHWREHIPQLIADCFARGREDYEGDRLHHRILRYLREHGGRVPYVQLLRNMGLRAHELRDALSALGEARRINAIKESEEGDILYELQKTNSD